MYSGETMASLALSQFPGLADYAKSWDPLAWEPAVTGRRLANILGHFEYYAANAEPPFQAALIDSLGRQARHLARVLPGGLRGASLMAGVKGLCFAALTLPGGEALLARARQLLLAELPRQVLLDGGQVERNPFRQVELLRDLIDIRALFVAAGGEAPSDLTGAIERMAPFLRLLRHGDGGLPLFNGGLEHQAWYLDLLLQRAGGKARPFFAAPQAGYQRLQAGRSLLIVDSGAPPPPGLDQAAHAGALSFEMSVGRERFLVNCGSHPFSPRWRGLLRGTAAHSTLSLDGRNSAQVLSEGGLGARPGDLRCRWEEQEGNVWLQLSHDGYRERFGVIHHRRLFLAAGGRMRPRRSSTSLPGIRMWLESTSSRSPAAKPSKGAKPASRKVMRRSLMSRLAMSARGAGSIAVISQESPPSARARARKRVEWPEPTSMTRAGRASRSMQ